MQQLLSLCDQYFHTSDYAVTPITGSGSNRKYYRIAAADGRSVIGVVGTSLPENRAFIYLARKFKADGISVPEIYAVSPDGMCYIQQDCGLVALFDMLEADNNLQEYSPESMALLKKTIALLPDIQFKGARNLDFSACYPQPGFDARMVSFDLNYFKYCFLKCIGLDFSEIELDNDFQTLSSDLLAYSSDTFMYRDFQARNVMIADGEPVFIDFQGGRRGYIYYDVASFVWQAKANYPDVVRTQLVDAYIDSLQRYTAVDRAQFNEALRLFLLFRTLQVLGAYGFRGYFERKEHFLKSIPFAIRNLRSLIAQPFSRYPYLTQLLERMVALPQFADTAEPEQLEIEICSFSYKKGLPADSSTNGGGYIFDCRGMHNPGRYEEYKHLTGRDPEVIDFLEQRGEVFVFLDSVYSLVDHHVECYLRRGFTHLMVAFGCTGGQHRSVYCADRLAEHLGRKYNVKINLYHREQQL